MRMEQESLAVVLNGEEVMIPYDLFEDEHILKSVLSYQTWQSLSAADKAHLQRFLPKPSVNMPTTQEDIVRLALSEDTNFKHGNAVDVLYRNLKTGRCSAKIIKQLKKCRAMKYKDYKLKEKQRIRLLLQEILVSRQRILDQLARHGPGQPIRTSRPPPADISTSIDEKVYKKYQKIIKEVKMKCNDDTVSSDEEDDFDPYNMERPRMAFYPQENHPLYRYPIQAGLHRMLSPSAVHRFGFSPHKSPMSQPFDITDGVYRDMLEKHRKRRILNEAHPELDVSTINLADIIMRANPTKKGNKKPKKVKKIKKVKDEKFKMKKKHKTSLPPLTAKDVLRIKQETARQHYFEKEQVSFEEKEAQLESSSVNDDEGESCKCFFALLRNFFVEGPDLICSQHELEQRVATWEASPEATYVVWAKDGTIWSNMVISALQFLAGEGCTVPDSLPLVTYIDDANIWKWTGIGHDDDATLASLCTMWLETIKNEQEMDESDISSIQDPQTQLQSHNQKKTDFVVRPSTDHEKAVFQLQEKRRYENPHKPFIYRMHGFTSIVGPVKGVFSKDTGSSKAREHALLVSNRPAYVTILSLVRDAVARLPNGEGTRAEVCQLLKDSLFINPEATDGQIHAVVSGALDRLHAEKDPCVKYDTTRKLWVYLHRVRSVEEFERIHQASAAAAMAKKQLNQKQKSSSKKRAGQDPPDGQEDTVKVKIKTSKSSIEKSKKASRKQTLSRASPSHHDLPSSFEQADAASTPSSSPLQSNFNVENLMTKEDIVPTTHHFPNQLTYFTSFRGQMPGSHSSQPMTTAVPLKITLPRGVMGSFSPDSMKMQISKPSVQNNLVEDSDPICCDETEISDHLIIDHDSSQFLSNMDSSFEETL